ncbi:hypothetical protein [uncultured Parasphingopyxis sp.]|uniref:hypothetical protein n=1 Tax=uncultured Parasphingopyxis sp. TaxID=1547918 RepID=UPI00260A146A|nr:hypothetical protein [uncultured Parasphingopyxis sp.]
MADELPMAAPTEEKSRLIGHVEKLIEDRRRAGNSVYYLSTLGQDLAESKSRIESVFNKRILDFVKDEIKCEVVSFGKNNNVYAINLNPGEVARPVKPKPRYKPEFWRAFFSSDDPQETRYISLDTLYFSKNRDEIRGKADRIRSIDPKFFADHGSEDPVADTIDKIERWLGDEGLDQSDLVRKSEESKSRSSLLDEILSRLSYEQKKKVTFSLDVIEALHRH